MSIENVKGTKSTAFRVNELRKQLAEAFDLFNDFKTDITMSVEDSSKSKGRILFFKNGSIVLDNFFVTGAASTASEQLARLHIEDLKVIADLVPMLYEQCEQKHAILVAQEEEQNKYLDDTINKLRDFVKAHSKAAYTIDEEAAERIRKLLEGKDVPRTQDTPFIPPHWPTGINPNKIYFLVDDKY